MEVESESRSEVRVQELQRSCISFELTLTASSVPSHSNSKPRLAVPAWFVRQHGDKIQESVVLQSKATSETWIVQAYKFNPVHHVSPRVEFYGGSWKAFAFFNALDVGDRLIFTLKDVSQFEVSADNAEKAVPCVQPPSNRSERTRGLISEISTDKISGCKEFKDMSTAKKLEINAVRELSKMCSKNCTPENEVADSVSNGILPRGSSSSSKPQCPLGEVASPLESCHGSDVSTEPRVLVVNHAELVTSFNQSSGRRGPRKVSIERNRLNHARKYRDDAPRKIELHDSLPSFVKELTASNYDCMEIPCPFVKTFSNQLRSPTVKLQGIHNNSPVRTVNYGRRKERENRSWSRIERNRFYLRGGWQAFRTENLLTVGEKFEFTLTGDSFFVVRKIPA